MTTPSRHRTPPFPTGRGWWLVAGGIVAGLLVFLVLWMGQRGGDALYRPDEQPPAAAAPVFKPLPAPPANGRSDASGPAAPGTRIMDDAPPPSAAEVAVERAAPPAREAQAAAPGQPESAPVPIESPSPRYPARALRRGESGEVLLRIHVDPRGEPSQVEVASSSGSRDLDRAALAAARRWRFRPAMRDGMPVDGVVNVPITFDSSR